MVIDKVSCCFTEEVVNAGRGGSLFLQTAQVLQFPISLADVGVFQACFVLVTDRALVVEDLRNHHEVYLRYVVAW